MAANLKEIERQARTLSADERASLAESLLESLLQFQVFSVTAFVMKLNQLLVGHCGKVLIGDHTIVLPGPLE